MGKYLKIYSDLLISDSATTKSFTANSIFSNVIYGDLNSQFIGSGNSLFNRSNLVTNTEFTRLSGLTGYVQTQLNSKIQKDVPSITYLTDNVLTNERQLSGRTNVSVSGTTSPLDIYLDLDYLKFNVINDTISGDNVSYSVNNYNPTNWSGNYPNRAFNIRIRTTRVVKLTGLSGGTDGRTVTITNYGTYLLILEHLGEGSDPQNRFKLEGNTSLFLQPNNSITMLYSVLYNKWIPLSKNSKSYNLYDEFTQSYVDRNLYSFLIGTGNKGFATASTINAQISRSKISYFPYSNGTSTIMSGGQGTFIGENLPSFIKYSGAANGAISLFKTTSTGTINVPSQIGVGTYSPQLLQIVNGSVSPPIINPQISQLSTLSNNNFENISGSSLLMVSKFTSVKNSPPYLGDQDNWAIAFGTQNGILGVMDNYSALTLNNTTIPRFSGGSFWLFDYCGNTQNARYVVQDSGNSAIMSASTFNLFDITGTTFKTFGIYSLSQSGNSFGSSTFFWTINSGGSENIIIEPPIIKTGGTILGAPSLNFFGAYNYYGDSNFENVANLVVDNFGYNYLKL